MILKIKLKQLDHAKGLNIPKYETPGSAGMDLCAANKKDITEIPKKLIKGLKIITVSNLDEVLKHALTKKISPIDWSKIPVQQKKTPGNELIV